MKLTLDLLHKLVENKNTNEHQNTIKNDEQIVNERDDNYKWISENLFTKMTKGFETDKLIPTLFENSKIDDAQVSGCGCKSQCDCKGNCDCRSECLCRAECLGLCGSNTASA